MADETPKANKNTLKYVSLITLTLQNAILGLSMRYARTRGDADNRFYSSTGRSHESITLIFVVQFRYSLMISFISRGHGRTD